MSSRGWGQQWRRLGPPPSSLLGLGNGEKISVGRTEPANPGVTVRRGLVVEGFTGGEEEEEFEVDVLWDGEPLEVLQVGGDTVTRVGVSEETGCRVLDVLGFTEEFGGCASCCSSSEGGM